MKIAMTMTTTMRATMLSDDDESDEEQNEHGSKKYECNIQLEMITGEAALAAIAIARQKESTE